MSKTPPDILLAIDIGTDSVKTLLAHRGKYLQIIGIGRAEHSPGAFTPAGAIASLPAVTEACDAAVAAAEQMAGGGTTARRAVMSIAGAPPDSPEALQTAEKIASDLSLDLIALSSAPFAIRGALPAGTSALVLDIGAHTTSVILVEDGEIEATATSPIGTIALSRHPATALSTWLTALEIAIEDLGVTDIIPPRVLLCGSGATLPEIAEALATTDWYQPLPFPRRPIIDLVDPARVVANHTNLRLDPSLTTALGLLLLAPTTDSHPATLRTRFAHLLSH